MFNQQACFMTDNKISIKYTNVFFKINKRAHILHLKDIKKQNITFKNNQERHSIKILTLDFNK